MSLPVVLSRIMGWKDLGVLYESLLGLGIITVLAYLKWEGQYPNIKQASVMFLIFSKQRSSNNRGLRCLQEIWSGPGNDEDEHLAIASLNSCLENVGHSSICLGDLIMKANIDQSVFSRVVGVMKSML